MPRWAVIGAWLLLALAMLPLQGPLQSRAADESDTFLARGSESAEAKRVIDENFRAGSESAAIIAYFREGGIDVRRPAADQRRHEPDLRAPGTIPSLKQVGSAYGLDCGRAGPARPQPGRSRPVDVLGLERRARDGRDDRRQHADGRGGGRDDPLDRPAGRRATRRACAPGSPARWASRPTAARRVKTIDETLLLVTCAVLILLLLAIYRSPLMALVPIFVVGVAYIVAGGMTYLLVRAGATTVSGQTTAILIVLMFGAGTDYCLLIVARFRDELRRTADPQRGDGARERAHRAGDPLGGRDRRRRDAGARGRRLQRHARDGADPRARHRRDGRGRADAAARRS